jgi:hypothetical protein
MSTIPSFSNGKSVQWVIVVDWLVVPNSSSIQFQITKGINNYTMPAIGVQLARK